MDLNQPCDSFVTVCCQYTERIPVSYTHLDVYKRQVDNCEEDLREKHIERLSLGQCTPQTGVIFLDVISNLERICDHANNVAGYVKNEL